jgi:hypothetical protein
MHSTLNQPFVQSAPLRQSNLFGICPAIAIRLPQKQKSERFCNFFAIADSSLPLQSGNEPL